jgi:hypothetical protein
VLSVGSVGGDSSIPNYTGWVLQHINAGVRVLELIWSGVENIIRKLLRYLSFLIAKISISI